MSFTSWGEKLVVEISGTDNAVSVTFTGGVSGQRGQIKVFGVSPRDGTTPTSFYFIQIRFA